MADLYVLDTSLLLGGKEPPRDAAWWTTPEADAEVSPGGRDAARYERWKATGLRVTAASAASLARVREAAQAAGSAGRLSAADCSLIALALDAGADDDPGQIVLVTDDYTILDVAARLAVRTQTVNQAGIARTADWQPRCSGCGRWFDAAPRGDECPVCGSAVKAKRRR